MTEQLNYDDIFAIDIVIEIEHRGRPLKFIFEQVDENDRMKMILNMDDFASIMKKRDEFAELFDLQEGEKLTDEFIDGLDANKKELISIANARLLQYDLMAKKLIKAPAMDRFATKEEYIKKLDSELRVGLHDRFMKYLFKEEGE